MLDSVFVNIRICVCFSGVLVGNKSDLSARREVQASVAQEWAQSQGLDYHETSAVSVFQHYLQFPGKISYFQAGITVTIFHVLNTPINHKK